MAHQVLAAPTPGAVPELGGPQPRLQVQSVPLLPRRFSQSPRAHQEAHPPPRSPDRNCWPATKGAHISYSYQILYMRWYRDVRNCHQKRHENKSKVGVTIFEDASRVWLGSKLFGARTLAWSQWAALVFVIPCLVAYNVDRGRTAVQPTGRTSQLSLSPQRISSLSHEP